MVLADLEMQRLISQRKKQQEAERKPAFQMRLGIHTGHMVAGIVGVKKF
jgi:class 3 adenylate cyclase